jgi:hypothetical protein
MPWQCCWGDSYQLAGAPLLPTAGIPSKYNYIKKIYIDCNALVFTVSTSPFTSDSRRACSIHQWYGNEHETVDVVGASWQEHWRSPQDETSLICSIHHTQSKAFQKTKSATVEDITCMFTNSPDAVSAPTVLSCAHVLWRLGATKRFSCTGNIGHPFEGEGESYSP